MSILEKLRDVQKLGGDTYSSYEVVGMIGQAADEIERLRAALTKCANKLERCAIAGGTNAEYAAIAVKEFRDLAE